MVEEKPVSNVSQDLCIALQYRRNVLVEFEEVDRTSE